MLFVTLLFFKASESACAWYNGDYQNFPDYYIDFLKQYFIAQIDAFEYGEMVGIQWREGRVALSSCLHLPIKIITKDDNNMQLRPLSVN